MTAWTLSYEGFDPGKEGLREALCTLGNGYLATRGADPEHGADGVHYPGTYAAGCYNRLRDTTAGETVENESLVNLPNWLPVTFRADDGPWLGHSGVDLVDQHRELDLQRGVLTRSLRVRDSAGRVTLVTQRRFVHLRREHVCGLQTTFAPEGWSGELTVRSTLDAAVENTGVARYRGLSSRHFDLLSSEPAGEESVLCVVATNQSHIRIAEAARTRMIRHDDGPAPTREVLAAPGMIGHEFRMSVADGKPVTVEKLVTVFTSRDNAVSDPAIEAVQRLGWLPDFDALLAEHVLTWRHLWQGFRVAVPSEYNQELTVVRLHLFHLMQTLSINSVDLDVGVPARGLHGEAYRGHVLWDELFVFPTYNLRMPVISRALLLYRYRRLNWARHAAREAGKLGAMYPWQSGSDGREESQRVHLNPVSGRWIADRSQLQRHVGLAVAYNAWQYYQVTGDGEFLSQYGAEMILEIARLFADLASYDHGRDRYVIRGVMGPDEFHTGYPDKAEEGIDNNAYTNVMAIWVLLRALNVLEILPVDRRIELIEALRISPEEPQRWEHITRRMFVPMHADGIISQFEGYEELAELDWQAYRERYGDIRRLDRILEAEGDTPNRYQASKQADVLMLFYLLSADELGELFHRVGYELAPDTIPRSIEYYLARTSHGSTLSAVVHAWVLARSRRQQALRYLVRSLRADIGDDQGGTTAEGIHLGAMAGSIDLLQRCFAGVETRGDTLRLNPYWPPPLGTLELDLRYREHRLTLYIAGEAVRVSAGEGRQPPIQLSCRGESAVLGPGEIVSFPREHHE